MKKLFSMLKLSKFRYLLSIVLIISCYIRFTSIRVIAKKKSNVFCENKTSLISQSAVGRLEETFPVSLVVQEKTLYLRSSCIALLGKSYL